MMSRFDAQKRTEWLQRFEKFEASGESVVRFCREAGVAPHTFYYWRKQLRGFEGDDGGSKRTRPDRHQSVDDAAGRQSCNLQLLHHTRRPGGDMENE